MKTELSYNIIWMASTDFGHLAELYILLSKSNAGVRWVKPDRGAGPPHRRAYEYAQVHDNVDVFLPYNHRNRIDIGI